MNRIVLLLLFIFALQGCLKQKTPVANNDVASLDTSPYFSIVGTGPVLADGSAQSDITITLIDSDQEPIVGIVPTFSATNCRGGNSYGTCSASSATGISICTLKSTCAETKTLKLTYPATASGGTVVFNAGPKSKLGFTVNPSQNVLVGSSLDISPSVQVQDLYGNMVAAATDSITLSAFTDANCTVAATGNLSADSLFLNADGTSGTAAFTNVAYDKWDDIYIRASAAGLTSACSSGVIVRQIVDTAASSVVSSNNNIVADGVSTSSVVVTLIDTLANPIVGVTPLYSATNSGGTNNYSLCSATDAAGVSNCTFTSTKAETKTLSVTYPAVFSDGTVDFIAGPADVSKCTISGTTPVVADNIAQSSVTVTLLDAFSNAIVGVTPTYSVFGTNNTVNACSASDANGISTCSVTSTKAEVKNLNLLTPVGKAGNDLTFVHGPVDTFTWTTAPSTPNLTTLPWQTQPVIALTDAFSNVITSAVTVALSAYQDSGCTIPASSVIANSTVSTIAGSATFSGLTYNTAETIYLKAVSGPGSDCFTTPIVINPRPEVSIDSINFTENPENIGQSTDQLTITLVGDTFSSAVSSDLVAQGKLIPSNVPSGLTVVAEVLSTTSLKVTLSGSAAAHTNSDDVSNIALTFSDSAFTTYSAAQVLGSTISNIAIDFIDPYTLSYSGATFNEVIGNTGAIENTQTVTLSGTNFTGVVSDDLYAQGKVTVNNLPAGLTPQVIWSSSTTAVITLSGQAAAHETDISNLEFIFNDTAFTTGKAAGVIGAVKSDLVIDFLPPAVLTYSATELMEAALNDGSINTVITIDLANDTFVADINGKFSITGVPTGLTAQLIKISDTQLSLSLIGNADNHTNANDTTVTVEFTSDVFTNNTVASNVVDYQKVLNLDFKDPPVISYANTSVVERIENDGRISESYTINLVGDVFVTDPTGTITATNVPTGLAINIVRNSDTQLAVGFSGAAISHTNGDDLSNIQFVITGAAFEGVADESQVIGSTNSALTIDFHDPPVLTYNTTEFLEDSSNSGATTTALTVSLVDDEFAASLDGKINFTNVPAGLTPVIIRDSASQMRITLSGNAVNHESADSVVNLGVTFLDTAFVYATSATDVTGYTRSDIQVTYNDAAQLSYDVTVLNEDSSNTGTITEKMTVTLTGDTFDTDLTGDISASNVPAGLTLAINRVDATHVELSFTGSAASHADADDVGNLTINFLANAFVGNTVASNVIGSNLTSGSINFIDPASLSYSSTTFNEDLSNTGTTGDQIVITLTGDAFVPVIGGTVSAMNVPSGMTAVFSRDSATQITMTLTGSADVHEAGDSINNLTITFDSTAFVNNTVASNVVGYEVTDRQISFLDAATLSYDNTTFSEDVNNIGATSDQIVITLAGDTFAASLSGKVTASNVPSGLTAVFTRDSATQVTMTLSGNADVHEAVNSITNLTITFDATAFVNNTVAGNVSGYEVTDRQITYIDAASLSYNSTTFNESAGNTGATSDSIIITLTGDSFAADITGKVVASNVPTGLSAVFTRNSATQITMSLEGSATSHESTDSVNNLTVTFDATAFVNNTVATNVTGYEVTDRQVSFIDAASLSYNTTTYTESSNNDGSIENSIIVTLSGDTFSADMTGKLLITNIPSGLSSSVNRDSDTQLTISLSGNATAHTDINDIANLTMTYTDSAFVNNAFASNVTGANRNDILVDFNNQPTLSFSATQFQESQDNDGSISNTITVTLIGDTFAADMSNKVTASALPSGLTLGIARDSDTQVTLSLTGNAVGHESGDDLSFDLIFIDGAFISTPISSNVTSSTQAASVAFRDRASLTYLITDFNEGSSNTGAVSDSILITLVNDTFTLDATTYITPSNVPAGLTAIFSRLSSTQIVMSFTGNAANHEAIHSVSDVTVTFGADAFTENTIASNVTNFSYSTLAIHFYDRATLTYSGTTFNEKSVNNGQIDNTLVITLTGDTFVSDLTSKIIVTNLPTGLSASFNRDSDTQITMSLVGTASAHENSDDVSDLTIEFLATAFTNNTIATNVTNYQVIDRVINFNDTASLAYSGTVFSEASANNGSISNSITITLTNDTFAADMTGKVVVSNIPVGLSSSLVRTSDTVVTLSLVGNADAHSSGDDISNLTIQFTDAAFVLTGSANDVTNATKSDLSISYSDQANVAYSGVTFTENAINNGSTSTAITVTLTGDTFAASLDTLYSAVTVPAGLTFALSRDSDTQLTLTLTGSATDHTASDNTNFTFSLLDGAFVLTTAASNVTGNSKVFSVTYLDQPSLAYSTNTFVESSANDGTIDTTMTVTLTGDTFPVDVASYITINNIPAGLVKSVTRTSSTTVDITFTSSATAHENSNDISNLEIIFGDSAFVTTSFAANVTNSTRSNFIVDFADKPVLTYSTRSLTESSSNNGSVTEDITITLTGDTFTVNAATQAVVTNLPNGLTYTFTRDSSNQMTLSFGSTAITHTSSDSVPNIAITFNAAAFTNITDTVNITDSSINDVTLTFDDPASLSFDSTTFAEAVTNDGSMGNTITITLTGDSFAADLTGDVQFANVPSGLTAQMTRLSDTQVEFALIGNALVHQNINDVGNVTITFLDNAFVNNTSASLVTNYNRSDIVVDFNDLKKLSYTTVTLNEIESKVFDAQTISVFDFESVQVTGSYRDQNNLSIQMTDSALTSSISTVHKTESHSLRVEGTRIESSVLTAYTLGAAFTVEMWLSVDDLTSQSTHPLFAFDENLNDRFQISATSAGAVMINSDSVSQSSLDGVLSSASWHHIALVVDSLQTTWNVYVDGSLAVTANLSTDWAPNDHQFVLGEDIFSSDNLYGYIDELRISSTDRYTVAFTPSSTYFGTLQFVGAIGPSVDITAEGVTFSGSTGDDLLFDGKVVLTGLPAGLSASIIKIDDSTAKIYCNGKATNHLSTDSLSGVGIEFYDSAFNNGEQAVNILNSAHTDFSINFQD